MSRLLLVALGLSWAVLGCQRGAPSPQEADADQPPGASAAASDLVVGEPIRHANLTIFPVTSMNPNATDRFVTLDEGLKSGQVVVMEMGSTLAAEHLRNAAPAATATPPAVATATRPASPAANPFGNPFAAGTSTTASNAATQSASPAAEDPFGGVSGPNVNQLLVVNRSERPLYLMPGEIIIGGQQDRAVGREYVIAPSEQPMPIDVFCVEHGRWSVLNPRMTADLLVAATSNAATGSTVVVADGIDVNGDKNALEKVASKTGAGQFVATVGNVGKGTRLALQDGKSQTGVWDQVRIANGSTSVGVNFASGTFTGNYAEPANLDRLEPYIEALTKPVAERHNVVGVIVAINGRVESVDAFESTPLFLRLWPKLLKSYALDAALAPRPETEKVCSLDDARQFFTKARSGDAHRTEAGKTVTTTVRDLADVICFSAHDATAQPAAAPVASAGLDVIGRTPTPAELTKSLGRAPIHVSGFAK